MSQPTADALPVAPAVRTAAMPADTVRVAYWSPLPPVRSGISDYSVSLLEQLKPFAELTVFVDGYAPEPRALWAEAPVIDAAQFRARHAARPYDVSVFHLGNNACHAYMADALLESPCPTIGVFHDGSLYHLYEGVSVRRLMAEIHREEGWLNLWRAWRKRRLPGSDAYAHPLLKRLARSCDAIATHSEFLARRCQAAAPGRRVRVVPFGAVCYDDDGGCFQTKARQALGLPPEAIIFGVFGHLNSAKRIEQVVEVFRSTAPDNVWLYLVGQIGAHTPQVVRDLAVDRQAARAARIRVDEGYRPYERVWLSMHAVDAGINLRHPTTGETSAVLCALLGMGKPVIVSDAGAFSELPDACTLKIPVDGGESAALAQAIRRLSADGAQRWAMSQAARTYSSGRTWTHAAHAYRDLIRDTLATGH